MSNLTESEAFATDNIPAPLQQNAYALIAHHHNDTTIIGVESLSRLLYFRQSFINDYKKCPQMALYRWVLCLEQKQSQFFSAFMGTAGHEVIYLMHEHRKFNYEWLELIQMFEMAFRKAINASTVPPTLGKAYKSIDDQFVAMLDEYITMLEGYQLDERNRSVYSIGNEQSFVLEVQSNDQQYLFTGQIDSMIFHQNGNFGIRDYKFRMNQFKPNKVELDLDTQFTIYSLACVKGYPACDNCRPKYVGGEEFSLEERHVVYTGPCTACKAKIDSKRWPRRYASPNEMIWMRDYERHLKDKEPKYIPDHSKPKIKGGKKGTSWVLQQCVNPDWGAGYKKGDYIGKCVYPTFRDPALIDTLMSDILRMCDSIRRGVFYRRPSDICAYFCAFREPCLSDIKLQVDEKRLIEMEAFASTGLED